MANFFAIPLCLASVTYIGTFINVALIPVLKDPKYFNIPANELGWISNDIIFYSQLIQFFLILAVGYIFDLIGRRWTICSVILIAAFLGVFIPYSAPSIVLLIFSRLGMVLAMSTMGSHPLVNDYVVKETRGWAIAI